MSQLLTQCPFCQTTFKVSDAQLQIASGVVRCGSCMEVFLATQHRVILKDRPTPASRQQSAPEYSADFPSSAAHTEPLSEAHAPGWEINDEEASLPDTTDTYDDDEFDDSEPAWGDGLVDENDSEDEPGDFDDVADDDDDDDEEPVEDLDDNTENGDFDEALTEQDDWNNHEALDESLDEASDDEEAFQHDDRGAAHDQGTAQEAAFSSWEAEEAFRADSVPPETEPGMPEPGLDEPDTALAEEEEVADDWEPDSPDEKPAYGGLLNPTGYSITSFSVDHVLPKQSAVDEALENDPALWDEPVTPVEDDLDTAELEADEDDEALPPDAIPEGEQFPVQPAAPRTAVIVPEKSGSIPTLVPDVLASEDIPAAGLGAQTMAWFQSFRKSFTDNTAQDENYAGTDEKAEIRSHLTNLRNEDSLEPVTSEALDVLDEDPVELPYIRQQWQNMRSAGMLAASGLLILAFGLQYAWFNLDTLVLERRFTGLTVVLCRLTTCPDTQLIDLSSLVTEELVVRSHPDVADALQVNFIFRNDRNREQPFPLVELNFTDIDGQIVANRVFTSDEYMPGEMQLFTHMPAHSSIQVSLDLVDPGSEATGYSLVFRNP